MKHFIFSLIAFLLFLLFVLWSRNTGSPEKLRKEIAELQDSINITIRQRDSNLLLLKQRDSILRLSEQRIDSLKSCCQGADAAGTPAEKKTEIYLYGQICDSYGYPSDQKNTLLNQVRQLLSSKYIVNSLPIGMVCENLSSMNTQSVLLIISSTNELQINYKGTGSNLKDTMSTTGIAFPDSTIQRFMKGVGL